jgi:hypothetical protein
MMPRLGPSVKTIGMLEIAGAVLVLICAWAAY